MRRLVLVALLIGAVPPAFALETFCDGNEELLTRYLEMSDALFNGARDESRAGEFYADDFRSPDVDVRRAGGRESSEPPATGPERMRGVIRMYKRAFPERELINDVIVCSDEFVIARVRVRGVMEGPMGDYAPTGKSFEYRAIDMYRFNSERKVFERWGVSDSGKFLREAGILQEVPGVRLDDAK